MSRYLIHNVQVFDSISPESYPGWVLVTDQRIEAVGNHATAMPRPEDAQLVDGNGGTLMPGLVEPHGHISFPNGKSADFTAFPVEEAMLETVRNAKTALDCGYTSVFSAASLKPRLDVVLKREIEAGRVPGPRYKACSPELTVTGGLGDTNKMHLPWIANTTFSWVVDGADEVRRAARMFAREGVDNLKVHLSGDLGPSSAASSEQTPMSQAELEALVEVARVSELNLVCHARSAASVKSALKYGIGIINHANYADEEALDGLEQAKDWAMVIPAIGITHALAYSDGKWDFPRHRMPLFQRELEITIATVQEMRKRGIRVLPGGDYGFVYTPHGDYARDLELFVDLLGFSPAETLIAATRLGSHVMGMPDEIGIIRAGAYADLLLVDGDPLRDIRIMQDREALRMIMKDGRPHKLTAGTPVREGVAA
jgi:imidazolonepropionase-like amidohydrolase